MICSAPIDSTPQTSPATFTNWARALTFTAAKAYSPSSRGEIVEIIRQAEAAGQRVKWTGSIWSFMGNFISTDVVIKSDAITGVIDSALILDRLTLSDPSLSGSLVHIKGGTKVFNVNRLLHGLPAAANGDGSDEANLECTFEERPARALPTLGGSGGQAIAGVMATGSHGGDIFLPPIADAVMAIHLIGPGGQEWWIERSSGLTAGTEADTQNQLQTIASSVPGADAELCSGILVKKDDDFFRSVLVSVGRMGFVYSMVVKTVPAFKLQETRSNQVWESFKSNLTAASFPGFVANLHFLQVLINPFGNGQHECKVAQRNIVDCSTPNQVIGGGGFDFASFICRQQDVRVFIPILLAALGLLLAAVAGLIALASVEFAAAIALAAIPFIGWALAAAMFAVWAATLVAIAALGVTIAALSALIAYLTFSGRLTSGELIAAIANFAYQFGLKGLMKTLLVMLFDSGYPVTSNGMPWSETRISWKIMDTYGYATEDFCQKVDSMEIAFDVSNADSVNAGYLAFLDDVFAIFDDLFNRNIAVAGIMSLRYTTNTTALIGMSKFPTTCHIEIPILRNFGGNAEFITRVQRAAIAHGGVPHWGQLMATYTGGDIDNLHGSDLTTWRNTLTHLIQAGGGTSNLTFSNDFTVTYHLEPFGLPANCVSGGPFPPVNLGSFSGTGTAVKSEDGDVTVDNVDSGFTLELTSQHGGITLTHKVNQHSSATLTACAGVSIGEKIDQHSQATILAHGDVTIGQKIDQWSTGIITSTKGAIDIAQKVDQHSQATLTAATTVHIGQKIDQHSNVTIVAQGDITIDQGIDQHAVADITSLNGSITIGEKVDQHSQATLTAATTAHIGQKIDQHSNVTIVAQGDITIDQGIDQHAVADITSLNGSITIGQAVDGGAEATLQAPNGNITIVQKVAGGASVKWSALSFTCPDTSGGTVTHI